MGDWGKMLLQMRQCPKNTRFTDICKLAVKFGFRFRGGRGSHRIYAQRGVFEILNFQNVGGMAKPYQIRQFLNVIDKYDLKLEE